nr:integrase, catalytic region, zinc finger, CCHC-type, peptidase aspartic, catalytic [Tanacetum cinerariifolium]
MTTMAENVIAAGSENRPPMLEKGMYDSWKTRIMLYIQRKENGEMLRDSVEHGPYKLKAEITVKDTDGIIDIRREERLEDLKGDDKLRYDSDIKAVNILLLGFLLNAEQADWKDDTDDESDDQELEAHYMYMAKIQEVSPDAVDSGPIFDTELEQKVQNDDNYDVFAIECQHPDEQIDQNEEDADLTEERELLASLIAKLKCEIDESKNRNTLLETSNKVLVEKLKSESADFRNKNKSLIEANNKLFEENDLLYADFKKSKAELKQRDSIEYATETELECAKVKGDLLSYKMEYERSYNKYTQTINDLNQTVSELKDKLSAHQDTISILKQQKDAQIKLYKIGCYNDNLALMLSLESDEVIRLEKESRSKLSDLVRPFDYAKLNSLYDLFVPQREKSSEQRFFSERSRVSHITVQKEKKSFNKQPTLLEKRLDESIPLGKKCKISQALFNVVIPATTIANRVEMYKKSITKSTYFGYLDPFIKNTIEQNFSPKIERVLKGLNEFQRCLKEEMIADLRYFNSLESEVDSLRSQLETQKTQFSNEIDRLS